ncbi:MAG: preprotein translocase subunit SecG [Flavobacteriales bacterium]|jgi:preprotein translocase subunit SecG|tara:strand:- start:1710 stop:2081 length:372 start_codon:yes stop_codon:yes gene_type:complete
MTALFSILIVVISILLVLVILVQNPKGGGLSAAFGGDSPQMLGGVKKTTDFLDKATWGLVIGLFVLVITMNMVGTDAAEEEDTILLEQVEGAVPFQPSMPSLDAGQAPDNEMPVDGMPESIEE